jgi:hypothetical protein
VAFEAWGGQNQTKFPWDKDPEFCHMVRCGMEIDNVLSMPRARDALRLRRLIGTPFAKKFLLDQEHIFKNCAKKMIDNLERLRAKDDNKVDVSFQFMQYSFDLLCKNQYENIFVNSQLNLHTVDISKEVRFVMV